ncbi:MAG: TIGR03364 family FAD-dependent oxidoreductase [Bacteroidota bacterium]|jgi:FAD dependent oxidoreductase TIGR03364|nr:TIGR03364 family FAD-dependent oxidoreductase [Cytophagales bacterium]
MKQFDLIVVGSGVLGTFHAYHAAKKGKLVLLLEKDNQPMLATVRNFGQIVPSGMGKEWFQFGVRGTEIYNTIQAEADISIRNNGSVYIASDADEQQLIHELKIEMDTRGYESILLSTSQCIDRWPALKSTYCKEGIFFPQEVSAEPNLLIHRLLQYCTSKFQNFVYQPGTPVVECSVRGSVSKVKTTFGKTYTAEKVIICNGGEFKLLFPELFERSGIKVSKLQMLQILVMPEVEMEGNILTGLTIRRYESFQECPSYAKLQTPDHLAELKKWGIHLLFKKAIDGSVIIGDSHEYAASYEVEKLGFGQNAYINQLMLAEAQRIVHFDVNKIASSWSGFYPQHNEKDIVEIDIEDRIHIRTAIGGKGMTTSAGYAEQSIAKLI